MPLAQTRHFGPTEYMEDSVIRLPRGVPGFSAETEFVVLQLPDQYPLVYLQSTRTSDLCFLALPVLTVDTAYDLQLADEDSRLLGLNTRPCIGDEALCLTLVAASEEEITANLLAPVVVNLHSRVAAQCINASGSYSHQHALHTSDEAVPA